MKMNALTIKEINISMLEEIKVLFGSVFSSPPWNEEWKDDQLNEYLNDLIDVRGSLLYGLFEDESMIGISIGKIKHWCGGTEYFIEELCIRNDYQRRGLGRDFFTLIKKKLNERGITQLFLMTDRDKPAYEFYKKIGFKEFPEIASLHMEF